MKSAELYVGRNEAIDRLNVSDAAFTRLVELKLVRKHLLPGMTYGRYYAEDVVKLEDAGIPRDPEIETKIRKLLEMETNGY